MSFGFKDDLKRLGSKYSCWVVTSSLSSWRQGAMSEGCAADDCLSECMSAAIGVGGS